MELCSFHGGWLNLMNMSASLPGEVFSFSKEYAYFSTLKTMHFGLYILHAINYFIRMKRRQIYESVAHCKTINRISHEVEVHLLIWSNRQAKMVMVIKNEIPYSSKLFVHIIKKFISCYRYLDFLLIRIYRFDTIMNL